MTPNVFFHDRTDTFTVPQFDRSLVPAAPPVRLHDGSWRWVKITNQGPSPVFLLHAPSVSDTNNSATIAVSGSLTRTVVGVGSPPWSGEPIYAVVANTTQPSTVTVRRVWVDQTLDAWAAGLPLTDLSGTHPNAGASSPTLKG